MYGTSSGTRSRGWQESHDSPAANACTLKRCSQTSHTGELGGKGGGGDASPSVTKRASQTIFDCPIESEKMDTDRTFRLLSIGFPTSVLAALLNVGLSSAAFFVPRLIGDKLPTPLRKLLRVVVTGANAAAACSLATW